MIIVLPGRVTAGSEDPYRPNPTTPASEALTTLRGMYRLQTQVAWPGGVLEVVSNSTATPLQGRTLWRAIHLKCIKMAREIVLCRLNACQAASDQCLHCQCSSTDNCATAQAR
jgi:hypothetical protein